MDKATSDCWLWTAATVGKGYGYFGVGGGNALAHRVSYEIAFGVGTTQKLLVCHTCDTPNCVNPKHLFLGTHADNVKDMWNKGRQPDVELTRRPGATNGRAKLNLRLASDIRGLRVSGWSVRDLSVKYGVGKSTIRRVISGESW